MKKLPILVFLLLITIIGAACDDSSSTTNSGPAALATSNLGKGFNATTGAVTDPTVAFATTDTVHCVVELTSAPAGTVVRTLWTTISATDASGAAITDTKLDEVSVTPQNGNRFVDLALSKTPLPEGRYKVEIFINEKSVRSLGFSVTK